MRSSAIFREYVWLLTTIRDAGQITFNDISSRWERASLNETGEPMSRTTFNRHRQAIEEIFDIEICCDRTNGNKYYIDDSIQIGSYELTNWMCDSLVMSTMLVDFKKINQRIMLEPVPTAGPQLRRILQAMTQNIVLEIQYQRIGEDGSRPVIVEPYAVRLFKQRWYMLGRAKDSEDLRLFSLERVNGVALTDMNFMMPEGFSVEEYFSDIYGVMSAPKDMECQRVVLRAFGRDRMYLNDTPMHATQKVIEVGDIYTDFELNIKPTPDFAAAILSRGGWVKVIEPQWFADDLLHRADFTLGSYENDIP